MTTVEASIALEKSVFERAERLAQQLNISPNELFETAIETFVRNYPDSTLHSEPPARGKRVIGQGDIYWVQPEPSSEMERDIAHPHVVIQDNLFNHSRIHTVVACALTSNIKRISDTPGNVLLEVGEANLPRQSVVEVSKISAVDKAALGEYIGTLSQPRVNAILAGIRFLQTSFLGR